MEPLSISALIISAITAISAAVAALHIRKMKSGCLDCDCTPSTPHASRSPTIRNEKPIVLQPIKNIDNSNGQPEIKTGAIDC